MSEEQLGRLEKVQLRDIWENEATDFTPWLAEEKNLQLLGETIGITLDLESVEKEVGSFYADILCKDEEDRWIVIENQLERTDHKHLGQIFTYGAGLKASVIIWIAAAFTEEHVAALDWLNEMTDERISFFGVEVEAWKIGNSLAAPKFNIVSQPNEWTRDVTASVTKNNLTSRDALRLEFWKGFHDFLIEHNSVIQPKKPSHRNSMNFSLGTTGFFMSAIASFYDSINETYGGHEIRVDIVVRTNKGYEAWAGLHQEKQIIESEFGKPLIWKNLENSNDTRYRVQTQKDINLNDEEAWKDHYQWLMENLEKMDHVFRKRIQAL